MDNIFAFHLFAVTQGIALLGFIFVWQKQKYRLARRLFSGLILSLLAISIAPQLVEYQPENIAIAIAVLLPAFFWLPVLYWWLTNYFTRLGFRLTTRQAIGHSSLPLVASGIGVLLLLLPQHRSEAMFIAENASLTQSENVLLMAIFALFISWLAFSLTYLIKITKQMLRYRRQLPALFSDFTGRELRWINWHGSLLLLGWIILAIGYVGVFGATQWLSMTLGAVVLMLFMLVLAVWGTAQQPGLQIFNKANVALPPRLNDLAGDNDASQDKAKRYQHSALTQAHLEDYAKRITQAMEEGIYLEPDLTMPALASRCRVPVGYMSQTLSQMFSCNFYQLVNRYRIEQAQAALATSQKNVLNIALASGFNTRSAFYNAFKAQTGLTPSQYRKQLGITEQAP